MKRLLLILVTIVFTLGLVGIALVESAKVEGTVTKIEGKKVTIKDEKGKETTVEVKDLGGAKVGDLVEIKDGKITVKKKAEEKKPAAAPGY